MLYVVIGPPAGGKSTWALQHAKPADIVIDFDRLAIALSGTGGDPHDHPSSVAAVTRAARTAAVDTALRHAATTDVYLIHSSPGAQRMAHYRSLGAQVVTIDPGRDVVRERCKSERPQRMFTVIDEWYREHVTDGQAVASPPVFAFPPTTSRDW